MKPADLEDPIVWYKNLVHISYTGRVIANFVFKYPNLCYGHILLTAVLRTVSLVPSLNRFGRLHIANEHQCHTVLKI